MTPKQIKFFKNAFVQATILTLVTVIFFIPLVVYILAQALGSHQFVYKIILSAILWLPIMFIFNPKLMLIYDNLFEIIESEQVSFIKALKLAIKRSFCSHSSWEAKYEENPGPCLFLDVKAKCSNCGAQTYEINKRAHESYKLQLADSVLFQRNMDKFPEFYKAALGIRKCS
jgi:hypothetical protein